MRAELTAEIKAEARRQVAAEGAPGLSLRAVTRSLGMASSAIYRYFPSRDDLLTALIVDAYDAVGPGGRVGRRRPVRPRRLLGEVAGHRPGRAALGARPSPRVRAGLRVAGARVPGTGGHGGTGQPGHARSSPAWSRTPPATASWRARPGPTIHRRSPPTPRRRPDPRGPRLPRRLRRGGRPGRGGVDPALRDDLVRAVRALPQRGGRRRARSSSGPCSRWAASIGFPPPDGAVRAGRTGVGPTD